jgi:hypothetical protein
MVKKVLALSAAAVLVAGAAFATPDKTKKPTPKVKPKAAKLIVITTCPTTGEDAPTDAGGSMVYGKYKVNFCCAGCKPSFANLSKEEKDKKLAELAAKQAEKKG